MTRILEATSSTMKLNDESLLSDGPLTCELNFIQLYDYLVVSTRKYRHIVLKGTNYKTSYQFFFEGNVKRLESETHENKTYVKASVLPSLKKTPYRVVVKFTPQCDVLRAACTCPAGLGSHGMGKCNHVGAVLFAFEDFTRRGLQNHPEPISCTSRLSVWVINKEDMIWERPAKNGGNVHCNTTGTILEMSNPRSTITLSPACNKSNTPLL